MVTITNADRALKTFYLGVVADQLNVGINPLMAKIGQTTADVWGKEIKKLAPYGINGGIGSGQENDELPISGSNNYVQFTLTLKNLFGKIEISDKAIRASQNSAGAFVNLLNAEMEGLLKASKFNFGRMLFGDGTGLLAMTEASVMPVKNMLTVNTIKNLVEGMTVDVYNIDDEKDTYLSGARITAIDRDRKVISLSKVAPSVYGEGYSIYVQGSRDNEITGLEAIFNEDIDVIYGLDKCDYTFLRPYVKTINSKVNIAAIQDAIDAVEEISGGSVDMIVTSYKNRKQYVDHLSQSRTNIDYLTLDGGYKALSYSGIPVVADRFVQDNDMYILNTQDFKLHQLCDWRWLEGEGGTVLHQIPSKAGYSATLVKYADLLCERPMGQAKISFTSGDEPEYYTVTFNSMGGSSVASQIVRPGARAVQPSSPTKSGKSFDGWLLNGETFTFSTPITSNTTLVASWL